MAYRRFRHFGKDKVTMDFAFFAIAFNIKKMCSKIAKQAKNGGNTPHFSLFMMISPTLPTENRLFWNNHQKSVAWKISKPQAAKKRSCAVKLNYDTASSLYYDLVNVISSCSAIRHGVVCTLWVCLPHRNITLRQCVGNHIDSVSFAVIGSRCKTPRIFQCRE